MIPGAFDIGSLQDEMTGVSLAGTQLRVNQYDMHDVEWNEVRITTINGARVLDDKKDIHIPQVSSVDKVPVSLDCRLIFTLSLVQTGHIQTTWRYIK